MPHSLVLLLERKAGISPAEFKEHWENHIKLLVSLTGEDDVSKRTVHYIARKEEEEGNPAVVILGQQSDFSFDGIAIVDFDNEYDNSNAFM